MRIGFYVGAINLKSHEYFDLTKGNPGIGGTEYIFLLLASQLSTKSQFYIHIYSPNPIQNLVPFGKVERIKKIEDAIVIAKRDEIDYFVFAPSTESYVYRLLDEVKLKSITWMQNRFTYDIANYISECDNIILNVCASREQYDCIVDHKICKKSVVIKNCVFETKIVDSRDYTMPIITYMGHLSYNRGFHIVAKQWKKIINKVPNAKLYVIGSADLYSADIKLGDLGIADAEYEKKFKSYITDDNGDILNSVCFCGKMGLEKYDIFAKTIIGIVNPLSREMGPLSALELEMCSIPVVSIRRYGQLETIRHKYSGLLVRNRRNLWRSIVKILKDENLYLKLSRNAKNHVVVNYSPEIIIEQWTALFSGKIKNEEIVALKSNINLLNDFKWLRKINQKLQTTSIFKNTPSMLFYEKEIRGIIIKIKKLIKG